MSHETAKMLQQSAHQAGQQLEYFITGAIGAVFAYMAQHYTPQKLGATPSTLEPIALVCLAGAFYCGLKRIECIYHTTGIDYERHQAIGDAEQFEGVLKKMSENPGGYVLREGVSVESLVKRAEFYRNRAKSAEPILSMLQSKTLLLYRVRNLLMGIAFGLIVLAKVLTPYF